MTTKSKRVRGTLRRKIFLIIKDYLWYYRMYMPDGKVVFTDEEWKEYDTGHAALTADKIIELLTPTPRKSVSKKKL